MILCRLCTLVAGKELSMPSLSPTMEVGTIVKWLKKEGDPIEPGDAIAEIQTDKAVVTMEFDDESILAKILVPEGTKDIKVGELIALTVERGEDWKSVEVPQKAKASSQEESVPSMRTSAASEAVAVKKQSEPPPPGQQNILMPALSPTMTDGVIVKWLKKEGETIEPGDALADIQTDKAVMTFEIDDEGILAKILVSEGSKVKVGQLIAITMEKGSDLSKVAVPTTVESSTEASSTLPAAPKTAYDASSPSTRSPMSEQVYGLAVKRLLEEYELSSGSIKGTGRHSRLLKSDVLGYIQANNVQKVDLSSGASAKKIAQSPGAQKKVQDEASSYVDIEVSNIRAVIAKRLTESKREIPHAYATIDIRIDRINEIRNKLKKENTKVSVNDFIVKAVAQALLECPDVNTLYQNGQIIRAPKVDVSVAVSTPSGLITPIVFDASSKSLSEISRIVRDLAERARDGKLKPQEFQGGTFTISNLGMFAIREFSAIINPPQTAILAIGSGRSILDDSLKKTTTMSTTLSYDRRAIDEDQAADFLAVLRAVLENPSTLAVKRAQTLRRLED
ncbi:uncharacterized protein LOC105699330 isoform X2 [Orussus abietinus]|uniref:uncharacterized protein LOC105699330 isoform X2 n=1 Tax=Orussus abietinus TaxID=222816 RepID=UPI0006259722|nr:uncharacterized protein LOC105699330 isoform X2 [Orussus abietinus]